MNTSVDTCRLFGGLINDMKARYSLYLSDITDGLHIQCFASIVFLYFACVTPIVTFGGLLGLATDNWMVTLSLLVAFYALVKVFQFFNFS